MVSASKRRQIPPIGNVVRMVLAPLGGAHDGLCPGTPLARRGPERGAGVVRRRRSDHVEPWPPAQPRPVPARSDRHLPAPALVEPGALGRSDASAVTRRRALKEEIDGHTTCARSGAPAIWEVVCRTARANQRHGQFWLCICRCDRGLTPDQLYAYACYEGASHLIELHERALLERWTESCGCDY